jgi:hypothetical protein
MTALANSLKRMWSAKNRVPHLTGWGTSGSLQSTAEQTTALSWARERVLELGAVARRSAPIVFLIVYNILR